MSKKHKNRYFAAYHRGGLRECLETEKPISQELFEQLLNENIYIFYCIDTRIGCIRYIIKDLEDNVGMPTWLHYYAENL